LDRGHGFNPNASIRTSGESFATISSRATKKRICPAPTKVRRDGADWIEFAEPQEYDDEN